MVDGVHVVKTDKEEIAENDEHPFPSPGGGVSGCAQEVNRSIVAPKNTPKRRDARRRKEN